MSTISTRSCTLRRLRIALFCVSQIVWVGSRADDMEPIFQECPGVKEFMDDLIARQTPRAMQEAEIVPSDENLRDQILALEKEDQAVRSPDATAETPEQTLAKIREVGDRHLPIIKSIASKHGFPTVEQIGREGVDAFWLLVQHAGGDPSFQEAMLEAIERRAATGEIDASKVALLTDRVLIAQGKRQRFGTQTKSVNGKQVVADIDDVHTLEARRKEAGLMPLTDYLCMLDVLYRARAYSDK